MGKSLLHLIAALYPSINGILRLLKERAYRHEILAYFVGMILIAFNSGSVKNYLFFTILSLFLFAVEAINTALEELIDFMSPEKSTLGKHVKDLGSAACLFMLLANIIYLGGILGGFCN